MIKNVLIVCIGNICRSPMAEALFTEILKKNHPDVMVHSAGLAAMVGWPADPMSQALMQGLNIDISQHHARQLTPELIFSADLILTMNADQQQRIEQQYPSARGRVHRLGKWQDEDVPDPYQRPKIIFEQALFLIQQGVEDWYKKLWN